MIMQVFPKHLLRNGLKMKRSTTVIMVNDIHIVFHAYSVYHVPIAEVLIHNAIVLWRMGSHGIIIYII